MRFVYRMGYLVLDCCVCEEQDGGLFVECALGCLDKHVVGWIHVIPIIGNRDIRNNPDVFNVGTVGLAVEELGESQHRAIIKVIDVCTLPVSLAGLPGISVPCGFDNGFPIGLQLIGKAFAESEIVRVADAYQGATNWHTRRP